VADFSLEIISGVDSLVWTDAAYLALPTRLNPVTGIPHRLSFQQTSTDIVIGARVGGTLTPLDAALGGRLFLWSWIDLPQGAGLPLVPPAGQTSKVTLGAALFTGGSQGGHYTVLCSRDGGGGVALSFETPVL